MSSRLESATYDEIKDDRGNVTGSKAALSSVKLVAEQVTELHRTLEADHTVTTVELPGVVNLYAVIDGGRILLDQLRASDVLEAVEKAAAEGSSQGTQDGQAATQP